MRIAICEIREETDSFSPITCKMEHFRMHGLRGGEDVIRDLKGGTGAVAGMLKACDEAGAEVIPLYSMNANSGGVVEQEVVDHFLNEVTTRLVPQLPVDGLFVSLHGAMMSTDYDDACGEILTRLRALAGKDTVMVSSYDLHANVTDKMYQAVDYLAGYNTYPHVDFFETGYRAAKMGFMKLNGNGPVMVRTTIPMMAPPSGYTSLRGPFGELMDDAKALVKDGTLVDMTIFQMQPWMDVADAQTTVVCVAFDRAVAEKHCKELAQRLFEMRDTFQPQLYTIDEVIAKAELNNSGHPIVLVDAPDSANAGACGDSPAVLDRILALGSNVHAACYLNDPRAVEEIYNHGVNSDFTLTLGGSLSGGLVPTVTVPVHVRSLHDGRFVVAGKVEHGVVNHIGRTAVLEIGNVDVLVCESSATPGDTELFRHFGIEPMNYQMVVVKACTSFRANYESFALEICDTDTPGAAPVNLKRLTFKKLPKYFHPFADISDYQIPMPR